MLSYAGVASPAGWLRELSAACESARCRLALGLGSLTVLDFGPRVTTPAREVIGLSMGSLGVGCWEVLSCSRRLAQFPQQAETTSTLLSFHFIPFTSFLPGQDY